MAGWRNDFDGIKNILDKYIMNETLFLLIFFMLIFFGWLPFLHNFFSFFCLIFFHFLWFYDLNSFFFCPLSFLQSFFDVIFIVRGFIRLDPRVLFLFGLKTLAIVNQKCACINFLLVFIEYTLFLLYFSFFSWFSFFGVFCSLFLFGSLYSLLFPSLLEFLLLFFCPFNPFYFLLLIFILIFLLSKALFHLSNLFSQFEDFFFDFLCLVCKSSYLWISFLLFKFFDWTFKIVDAISNAFYFVVDFIFFCLVVGFYFFKPLDCFPIFFNFLVIVFWRFPLFCISL